MDESSPNPNGDPGYKAYLDERSGDLFHHSPRSRRQSQVRLMRGMFRRSYPSLLHLRTRSDARFNGPLEVEIPDGPFHFSARQGFYDFDP